MQSVPRVGVVGCGYWGKNLVRNFYSLGALAALCDADSTRLDTMARQYGVHSTNDVDELLSMGEIDAVAISVPAVQHFEIAKKALLAGKDVFVEKPLALQVEDGEELVALAGRRMRIVMVGHLLRYHPAILELDRLIRSGELGKVEYISSSRLNLGKVRTEEDILWSFAPHDLSVILFLLREDPLSVTAHGASYLNHGISDVTLSILNFQSGVKAHVFVSWLHPFKEQKLVVVGDRQMAVFDDTEPEHKLALYPYHIDWINRAPVAQKEKGRALGFSNTEPLQLECEHFLACVRERTTPWTDGYSGLDVLRVLRACDESIKRQGREVFCAKVSTTVKDSYFVHPTSIVDGGCQIGEGTAIWHFSHVTTGSHIGRKCTLGQNVYVAPGVRVGNNVKIQNNVSVYTGVELEDDVFCGPSMVFTNVINPRSHISRKHEYRRTLVKHGTSIGANAVIVCGTTLGRYSFVAAGAVVTKDVPDNALMVGVPAVRVGWMCECGVRLPEAIGVAQCTACGKRYQVEDDTCHEQSAGESVLASEAA